ncbi:F-box only protein 36-like [Mytilus californianus]|uniref:F-box only protein 36-like n=1 Tax=Mytilus californianus TaxID=6549 RepID=UPI002247DE28|nr:F-box only protein 36-like [Mytilus californianus]
MVDISPCWLNEHNALVDFGATANAPSKDFYHVFVTQKEIVLRLWKIVPPTRADSHTPPAEYRNSYKDFEFDDRCHSEIQRVAGEHTLDWLLAISRGHIDYLSRLPRDVLIKIILNLGLEDIGKLGRTSHQFKELCNSCDLWEQMYRLHTETAVTPELEDLAKEKGWKKLFFTNKLQLQLQLRRLKKHEMDHEPSKGHAFITE